MTETVHAGITSDTGVWPLCRSERMQPIRVRATAWKWSGRHDDVTCPWCKQLLSLENRPTGQLPPLAEERRRKLVEGDWSEIPAFRELRA